MMDAMFDLPTRDDVDKCIITKGAIDGDEDAKLIGDDGKELKLTDSSKQTLAITDKKKVKKNKDKTTEEESA